MGRFDITAVHRSSKDQPGQVMADARHCRRRRWQRVAADRCASLLAFCTVGKHFAGHYSLRCVSLPCPDHAEQALYDTAGCATCNLQRTVTGSRPNIPYLWGCLFSWCRFQQAETLRSLQPASDATHYQTSVWSATLRVAERMHASILILNALRYEHGSRYGMHHTSASACSYYL